MTNKIPERSMKKLYELMRDIKFDGCDVSDTVWDWGTFFSCAKNWEACNDAYDRFCLLLALNVDVIGPYQEDWYTACDWGKFMWDNNDVFGPWFNKHNREGYRPKDYKGLDPKKDTGFYEAYMQPLESLLCGNYSEESYDELFKKLSKKCIDPDLKTC